MHKFTCTECPSTPFFTTFAPVYDEKAAFCPNCGDHSTVTYIGEVNHAPRFEAIHEHFRKLYDIRRGSMKYGLSDLADWIENDLDKMDALLDALQYEVLEGE